MVAGHTGTLFGVAMTKGDIYSVAGNGRQGYSGDGGPATAASLDLSSGLSADHAGNILLTSGNRIRVVAASTGTFYGQQMTTGDIYTVAGNGKSGSSGDGGPATHAELDLPNDVIVDHYGNLLMDGDETVRMVAARSGTYYGVAMKAGDIYTIAGNGGRSYSGNGNPALKAGIRPIYLAVDGNGNVVMSDESTRIRVVAVTSGTFYGIAMTAGDVYTVAGTGAKGYTGDGGPAIDAQAYFGSVTSDPAGNLLLSDYSGRVRQISN